MYDDARPWRGDPELISTGGISENGDKREAKGPHRASLDDVLKPVLLALATDQPWDARYRDRKTALYAALQAASSGSASNSLPP